MRRIMKNLFPSEPKQPQAKAMSLVRRGLLACLRAHQQQRQPLPPILALAQPSTRSRLAKDLFKAFSTSSSTPPPPLAAPPAAALPPVKSEPTTASLSPHVELEPFPPAPSTSKDPILGERVGKYYHCPLCTAKFVQRGHLNRHVKNHQGERPFACDQCDLKFTTKDNMQRHKVVHNMDRQFPCTVCDKSFLRAGDLKVHMRTHTGEKPYHCTVCTKAFPTSGKLMEHTRSHTGEQPYVCNVCGKRFSRSSNMVRHRRQLHMDIPEE
ncbi:hypothetical protein BASA81_014022 [Batrachochytrium salamandrivorans]|nr:hypothetical protein BASA81_014022 [Batrachochytrium salamandrivorans]